MCLMKNSVMFGHKQSNIWLHVHDMYLLALFYLTILQCVALKMGGYALVSVSKIMSKVSETLLFTFIQAHGFDLQQV